ncbi:hypothetical protein Q31b_01250 [Novipirellula aureliae]|uniref:Uncharacterized protein n=1 Tax=Novipirellula aureliae TaxID=2527966 RepID=A0A5C6E8R1_9BACT|nr:hypothetical protein [Novipirellula aureliae]TWU44954.1 hypothetical protein Q31b_01250 [Novipirellula aureliae]
MFDLGSALECVAIQDVLAATDSMNDECHRQLKQILHRIVSMLTRMIARSDLVAESATEYNAGVEYKYEYRDAEYEYDEVRKPEPSRPPKDGYQFDTK